MLFKWILTVFTRILSWLIPFTACVHSCLPCTKRGQLLYKNLIYQWLTSHIANWLHLGAELPFLNNSSHQNYIGPRLRVRKIKKAPFLLYYSHFHLFWLWTPSFVYVCLHVTIITFSSQIQWIALPIYWPGGGGIDHLIRMVISVIWFA